MTCSVLDLLKLLVFYRKLLAPDFKEKSTVLLVSLPRIHLLSALLKSKQATYPLLVLLLFVYVILSKNSFFLRRNVFCKTFKRLASSCYHKCFIVVTS